MSSRAFIICCAGSLKMIWKLGSTARPEARASFAYGVVRDRAAVQNAITSQWSNGQTEGQIAKLKLIKRQMYGRGKLDLLEARIVGANIPYDGVIATGMSQSPLWWQTGPSNNGRTSR